MEPLKTQSFNAHVEDHLGLRLPQKMADAISLTELPSDTQAFILRMLTLMKRAGYSVTGFTPLLVQWLAKSIPSILPSAWDGRIPPLTLPNRHRKLDAYIAGQKWPAGKGRPVFLDLGCGFPPVTTADTASKLSDWQVYGVDCSFDDFVLYTGNGHYACFYKDGTFQYFQALMSSSGRDLYADPDTARAQFIGSFNKLSPLMQAMDPTRSETVEEDQQELIWNHIRDFETDNLSFIQADFATLKLPPVQAVRCMNLLIYFKPELRKKMLLQAGRHLADDGLLIVGTNGLGIQSRYAVYRKNSAGITPIEFAFSLDNLGHIAFMPWFTLHANDPEALLLADLARTIRDDQRFWADFSYRLDQLLDQYGVCSRGTDGFLHFPEKEIPPSQYLQKNNSFWRQIRDEGYLAGVVEILRRAGYVAWENPVGDVAIRPATDYGF